MNDASDDVSPSDQRTQHGDRTVDWRVDQGVDVPVDELRARFIALGDEHDALAAECAVRASEQAKLVEERDALRLASSQPRSPRLTFGDLQPGDHFIGFPLPGDDSGHGGYLGAHRLFIKTRAFAPPIYENSGVASSDGGLSIFPNTMHVIKVQVGSADFLSKRPNLEVRHWRDSGVAWFWSGDREDFGSVFLEADQYVATTVRGSARFESLADAKAFVEEHSS